MMNQTTTRTKGIAGYSSEQLDYIKETISCIDYCQEQGVELSPAGNGYFRGISPFRPGASNPTSLMVDKYTWSDHGAGLSDKRGGDIFNLVMAFDNCSKYDAAVTLARRCGIPDTAYAKNAHNMAEKIELWHKSLRDVDIEYITSRGITLDTIKQLKIGRIVDAEYPKDNDRIVVPYYNEFGHITYYASRVQVGRPVDESNGYPKYKKCPLKTPGAKHIIWGYPTLKSRINNPMPDTLIIAEGMFDAISFYQEKFSVISAITGRFSHEQMPAVLKICRQFKEVFIIYDYDPETMSGQNFSRDMAQTLLRNGIPFKVGILRPEMTGRKIDVSEYYQKGGNLLSLVRNAEDGWEYFCSQIKSDKEFADFMLDNRLNMSQDTVARIISHRSEKDPNGLGTAYYKELQKQVLKEPSDTWIAERVLAGHKLAFSESTGYMEYDGLKWEIISDTRARTYINDVLKNNARDSKTKSVLKTMQTMVNIEELSKKLNQTPCLNMMNGVLRFSNGKHIFDAKHRAEDYCTYVLPYAYDPDARCQKWIDFTHSVLDGDIKTVMVLQEYFGYVFFQDCRFEKALVLSGEGSNGKSVVLDTAKKLYGADNCSGVSMTDLASNSTGYNKGDLGTHLANIASETASDATGAEDAFKKVTSGEAITARQIYKSPLMIIPRAKWFIACNAPVVSKTDRSDGWRRRMLTIEFKLKFVDSPTLPHERKIDYSLKKAFNTPEELAGILNWALEGFARLNQQGKFTESEAIQKVAEEYREIVDPVVIFAKEVELQPEKNYSRQEMYDKYKEWCVAAGQKQMSRQNFTRSFRNVIKEYRHDIDEARINGYDYFRCIAITEPETGGLTGIDVTGTTDNPFLSGPEQNRLFN